jgi:hypothetical protein
MQLKLPKAPQAALIAAAGLTVWGVTRAVNDVAEGVGDAADAVRERYHSMGKGTRAALPMVVLLGAIILWKKV